MKRKKNPENIDAIKTANKLDYLLGALGDDISRIHTASDDLQRTFVGGAERYILSPFPIFGYLS